jgi:hypothetical protein
MSARPANLLVFRDGRKPVCGTELKSAFAQQLRRFVFSGTQDTVLGALLRAGELECSTADSGTPSGPFEKITDALAEALVNPSGSIDPTRFLQLLETANLPEQLTVSTPEGFAYYALHPLAFADVIENLNPFPEQVLVVGIRSIGATLSAVTAAALRQRGIPAERITVRPEGHPFHRRTSFSAQQLNVVRQALRSGANFLVVDEGPGISGSSFLSVAEALVEAGVPKSNITLICSYEPHVDALRGENAPQRWRQFRWMPASAEPRQPEAAQVYIGAGEWRRYLLHDKPAWPASWINFERLKYLSAAGDPPRLFKFLGFAHYGAAVMERETQVAAAGFGPLPMMASHGFASFPFLRGRPMSANDLAESVLARVAAYCAFRTKAFASEAGDISTLQQMADHNLRELRFAPQVHLRAERLVITDGHMDPHEWLLTPEGQMLKTDSGAHGDDHFFPGPTDMAWDLAGAIVEWRMNQQQAAAFLEMYRRASGDDARSRIADYITAYTVFRCAYSMMAANALEGTPEEQRLDRAAADYGALLMENNLSRELCR